MVVTGGVGDGNGGGVVMIRFYVGVVVVAGGRVVQAGPD